MLTTSRPAADEYASSLAGYIARISDHEDIVDELAGQLDDVLARFASVPGSRGEYRYSLAYVIAGHTRHHLEVVEERYLG